MLFWPRALLFFLSFTALPAQADTAYVSDTSFCGPAQALRAPAAPAVACANFRPAHASLIEYARSVVSVCARANARFHAVKQSTGAACAAGPAARSDACGSAMYTADGSLSEVQAMLNGLREPHEKNVRRSFPASGEKITATCLPTLDALQEFSYAVGSALQAPLRHVQAERASLRSKVSVLLRAGEPQR